MWKPLLSIMQYMAHSRHVSNTSATALNPVTRPPHSHDYDTNRQAAILFVGDLPPMTTSQDLVELFSQFAPVADAKVIGSQCYAFLTFENQPTALRVQQVCSSVLIYWSLHARGLGRRVQG